VIDGRESVLAVSCRVAARIDGIQPVCHQLRVPANEGSAILVQGLLGSLSGGAAVSSTRMKRLIPFSVLVVMLVGACASAEPAGTESTAALAPSSTSTTTSTSTSIGSTEPDPVEEETVAEESLPDLGPADELRGIDGWLQADIESLDDLRGKVVVVQFWTFGCHNCKATLPNLEALYAEHRGTDFEIVGVHSPEFDYEKDPDAIAAAAEDLGVTWPIALDTARQSFRSWQGSPAYWPRTYVLDREGHIRFDHIGEGAYEELNETVAVLLK